ncbi:MAG: hypothetical protein ABEJ92_09355 [Halobacteriales archaeon]
MDYAETLRWAGVYLGLWLLAAVVGGAVVVAGVALGGLAALGAYQQTPFALRVAYYPRGGLAVIGLGLVVFKVGSTGALLHVVVSATEARLPSAVDTEGMKSDILSVLDERLAEMHGDLRAVRRAGTDRAGDVEDFEFE